MIVDWRHKGFGPDLQGLDTAGITAGRPDLFDGLFTSPVAAVKESALAANIATMARFCRDHGVAHAPHGKTTLAPAIAQRQVAAGAWGITTSSVREVRIYYQHGLRRFFLANQVVDPGEVRWLAETLRQDPEFAVSCYVDSADTVRILAAALAGSPAGMPPLPVVLEVGAPGGRAGVRDREAATTVARAAAAEAAIRLIGVAGYEGILDDDAPPRPDGPVTGLLRELCVVLDTLLADALIDTSGPVLLSAGGSVYLDVAADILTSHRPAGADVAVLLRSGAYVTHDDGIYLDASPLSARRGVPDPLQPAFELWSRIISLPEPGLAIADFGRRDAPHDAGLPVPREIRRGGRSTPLSERSHIAELNDQHAYLRLDGDDVVVGDWLRCGISHPCTAFDRWRLIPVVDDDYAVVDVLEIFA